MLVDPIEKTVKKVVTGKGKAFGLDRGKHSLPYFTCIKIEMKGIEMQII